MHYANDLYIFSSSKQGILQIDTIIRTFLDSKGLFTSFDYSVPLYSMFDGFCFLGWKFFLSRSQKFLGIISIDNLRNHMRKLKLIIKSSFSEKFFFTLKKLNLLISNWSNVYRCADFSNDIWGHLDVYLYKLLWNWAKRRHPRRPNTWIYSKYWKFSLLKNVWNFYFIDYYLGKCITLNMHKRYNNQLYCLPSSINVFNLKDHNKFGLNWLKNYSNTLSSIYLVLYKFQSGKCFCCGKFFSNRSFHDLKFSKVIYGSYNIKLSKYVLIHTYCTIE